jgi:hypothetical protein
MTKTPSHPGASRGFSRTFLVWLSALFLAYLALAVWVDPRGDFGVRAFPIVALDSRKEKMDLFDRWNRARPVEGLVLGSSRSMKIDPADLSDLTSERWFNFAVDSARAEDYLAIYRWAHQRDPALRALLVGLDVEAFHDRADYDDRLKSDPGLMRALEGGGSTRASSRAADELGRLKSVLSRYYAEDMVRSLRAAVRPAPPHMNFDGAGFLHYGLWEAQRAAGTFDMKSHLAASREEYLRRFREMRGLSVTRRQRLVALLREALRDRVRVVVWITPIHPDLANYLGRETSYRELLAATRDFAAKATSEAGIPFYDFSTPEAFGGDGGGWYDGGHIDENNSRRIMRAVAASLKSNGL